MHLFYLLNIPLRDGSHAYTETNLDRLVVEPWNFFTAAFFCGRGGLLVSFFCGVFQIGCCTSDATVFVPHPIVRNPLESFIFAVQIRKPICH